nr:alpha-1,2-fucosyltransferase [Kineococcus siccus]
MGGLGNQLFQYVLARTLADRTGAALVADRTWFAGERLRWELDDFQVRVDAFVDDERGWAAVGGPPGRHVAEAGFRFDPTLLGQEAGVLLEGYFQSPRYGEANVDALRADLRPRRALSSWATEVAEQLAALPEATSLHVRRGDYVSNPAAQAVHGTCSPEYYRRALDHLDAVLGGPGC